MEIILVPNVIDYVCDERVQHCNPFWVWHSCEFRLDHVCLWSRFYEYQLRRNAMFSMWFLSRVVYWPNISYCRRHHDIVEQMSFGFVDVRIGENVSAEKSRGGFGLWEWECIYRVWKMTCIYGGFRLSFQLNRINLQNSRTMWFGGSVRKPDSCCLIGCCRNTGLEDDVYLWSGNQTRLWVIGYCRNTGLEALVMRGGLSHVIQIPLCTPEVSLSPHTRHQTVRIEVNFNFNS